MNDPLVDERQQPVLDAAPGKSAGRLLREAREAAGIHIGALAVSLKVPVKRLEALEADNLAQLPDAVFARALAATICRSLKVDPEPVLARLPQLNPPPLKVGSREAPVRLPSLQIAVDPAVVVAPDGVAIGTVPNLATQGSTDVSVPGGVISPTNVSVAVASLASAAATAEPAAAPATAATPAATTAAGGTIAIFTAREAAWVQVVDAAGLVQLRKTMSIGETVGINGTLPLSVTVGRANAIDVVVRGKPFDVRAVAKDNVSRFQIQ